MKETARELTLRDVRLISRFTQEQVAGVLGVSTPTYAKMEKNPQDISLADAKRLSALFNTPISVIFFNKEL